MGAVRRYSALRLINEIIRRGLAADLQRCGYCTRLMEHSTQSIAKDSRCDDGAMLAEENPGEGLDFWGKPHPSGLEPH